MAAGSAAIVARRLRNGLSIATRVQQCNGWDDHRIIE
jgi:hypothetical protein